MQPDPMLLVVSHSAARAAFQPDPNAGKVNLAELHQVRLHHLPGVVIKLTPLPELDRRVAELTRELPHYAEEAAFVLEEERYRRYCCACSPLRIAS